MAKSRVRDDQPLVPSVFDRLLDDEPDNSRETAASRRQVLRELKQSVGRDLENLLNTRQRCGAVARRRSRSSSCRSSTTAFPTSPAST